MTESLQELADEINRTHRKAIAHARVAIQLYQLLGEDPVVTFAKAFEELGVDSRLALEMATDMVEEATQ